MKKLAVIPATIALLRAHFDRGAGRVDKAKMRVEQIRLKYPDIFEFLDAFYGLLLTTEGDSENAQKYFRANAENLPFEKDDNQRYIELYCTYFLEAFKKDFDWESLISEANRLKPDSFTKELLRLPTREQVISALSA